MFTSKRVVAIVGAVLCGLTAAGHAEPIDCQKNVVRSALKYKRTFLRVHQQCLDKDNAGKISGPCPNNVPDPGAAIPKLQSTRAKAVAKIAEKCTFPADLTANSYPLDCSYEAIATGKEGDCADNIVASSANFADCLLCWKEAELAQFVGTLYASHAVELCGSLDASSTTCSDFPCTTPLPVQRDLGFGTSGSEYDCQRGIAREGNKYLVTRERVLEKCALAGGTRANCLDGTFDGGRTQGNLAKAEGRKAAGIMRKCGNRVPVADPPYCCRTGAMNACMVSTSRDDCEMNLGGQVMENKTCELGSCAPVTGPTKPFTWWENCPEPNTCGTAVALATIDDVIDCIDATADLIVDELLCIQFRQNGGADWPCPSETVTTTTTSTTTSTT